MCTKETAHDPASVSGQAEPPGRPVCPSGHTVDRKHELRVTAAMFSSAFLLRLPALQDVREPQQEALKPEGHDGIPAGSRLKVRLQKMYKYPAPIALD